MEKISLLAGVYLTIHMLHFSCSGQNCSTTGDARLYSSFGTSGNEGSVQTCYNGEWYLVCDYNWDCAEGNVVCRQLGLGKAREVIHSSYYYYGSWDYIRSYYYDCSGFETSLDSCEYNPVYKYCNPYDHGAGVRCTGPLGTACSEEGDVRLIGGNNDNEGILEYCSSGAWSAFCSLDDEDATVACKQLGHYQYKWASVLSPGTFPVSTNYSLVTFECSSTAAEYKLSDCKEITSLDSWSCVENLPTCSTPFGIRCYDPGECTEGDVRLVDGVLEQEGRVEVCVNGVWGTICGYGWNKIDGYVLCKQAGFDDAEPTVYTNSKFGDGYGPIVYAYVECNGWENDIIACPKYEYLQFSCSRSSVSGVLCHDDCKNGDVRLTGGDFDWEGTVEVCFDDLWGTIADSGWDSNDAAVICRQLGYSTNGMISTLLGSFYDRPNRTVHFSNVGCLGIEQTISECSKSTYSLESGKAAMSSVEIAGVQCLDYIPLTKQPCLSAPAMKGLAPQCNESDLRLVGGNSPTEGRLEFCYQQQWSPFCTLRHVEASVACKQLGYTQYTWAAIVTSGEFGSSQNYSLFDNITCSDTASEYSLGRCTVNVGTCLSTCTDNVGIRCFEYGTCSEGDSRIVDGIIAQEGRIEVCVSGVWGSVCSTGWDSTDANVICRQLGFPESRPIPYYGFGTGSGPVVYSDVDCTGWENSLSECTKESYLAFDCPPFEVAGVFCADYCFTGEIRLVGGESDAEGTVEICFDSLWGLIDESGWGLNDARVVCEQLGYGTAEAQPVYGSLYGKPNKPIHASGVFCLGDEEELIECTVTLHSLDDGRLHLDDAQVVGVSCAGNKETSIQPSTLLTTLVMPSDTAISCSTMDSASGTTVTISTVTTISKTISSVLSVTTTAIITSTTSTTIYSTLTSTSVSTATSISTDTITHVSTSTVSATGNTTKLTIPTVTITFTQAVPTTVYATSTDTSTTTHTATATFTATITETSTAEAATETYTATATSTATTTVYISYTGSSQLVSCNPTSMAGNQATNVISSETQTPFVRPETNTVEREPLVTSSNFADTAGADSGSSNINGSSSTLLIIVALAFILIAIVVVVGVVVVVVIVKKQNKEKLPHLYSSGVVDYLSASPSNQHSLQESALEKEAEKLKEANEERRDAEHEDLNSLETPQDHSHYETGL